VVSDSYRVGGTDTADPEYALEDTIMNLTVIIKDPVTASSRFYDYPLLQPLQISDKNKKSDAGFPVASPLLL